MLFTYEMWTPLLVITHCFILHIFICLQIAVASKYHGVPFYVAAPFTSIDFHIPNGERIVIEERPEKEMTHIGDHRIAAPGL